VFAFILESIKYVIHFLIILMKNFTTSRQTASTTSNNRLTNNSTSRTRQIEDLEDPSQVRVYYIQGFFISKLRSNSRLSLLLLSWHFFLLVLAQNSIPSLPFFVCYSSQRRIKKSISLMNCVNGLWEHEGTI
jgi:hypothetical protein